MTVAGVRRIDDPTSAAPFPSLNALFARVVAHHGERPAIRDGLRVFSYAELDRLAAANAARLAIAGAQRGDRIGVAIDRSAEAIVAMLAILRLGCAYVPFDPRSPADRVARQAADAGIRLSCVAQAPDRAPGTTMAIVMDTTASTSFASVEPPVHALEIAYVIYTSGSTGEPKGVEATHGGVANLILHADYCPIHATDVVFHGMSNAFDGATFEIWGALLNGATLAIAPPRFTIADITDFAAEAGVTIMMLTTGLFNALRAPDFARLRSVRVMLAGGDVMSPAAAQACLEAGGRSLVNGYGPTETTTFSHCHTMCTTADASAPIPIGRPVHGAEARLVDDNAQVVAAGTAELVVSGIGLARGYLGKPARTAERFLPDPFGALGGRMYLTGDLAFYREDETFGFAGRIDHQVKIDGFRVEPGEVEQAILSHPGIAECCVLFDAGALNAFCAPMLSAREAASLRASLGDGLPSYMVPASIRSLECLPLTINGKVDRATLARMLQETGASSSSGGDDGIVAVMAEALQRPVAMDDNLLELGFSSLDMIRLCAAVDQRLGVRLTLDVVMRSDTVADLAQFITLRVGGSEATADPKRSPEDVRV